ncbi:MAG: hypothetical protein WBA11_05840, partial [Rubrivirga sp.]
VWVAGPEAAPERLTSFGGARVSGPRWSPDGQRLVVSARADGDADVFVVLPSGEVRQLTDSDSDDVAPTWSRDGMWVYFASDRGEQWQIYRVPSAGGNAEAVTVRGGVAAAEAPGGGLLLVRPDQRGLWLLSEQDGEIRDVRAERLPVNLSPADWANWTVQGETIVALERRFDRAASIVRIDPVTRQRSTVAVVPEVAEDSGLGVFPDGRLLLSQQERTDSDIVLVRDFQ